MAEIVFQTNLLHLAGLVHERIETRHRVHPVSEVMENGACRLDVGALGFQTDKSGNHGQAVLDAMLELIEERTFFLEGSLEGFFRFLSLRDIRVEIQSCG